MTDLLRLAIALSTLGIVVGLVLIIAGPRIQRSRDRKYLRERQAIADLRLAEYRRLKQRGDMLKARAEFKARLAERNNGDVESPPARER